MFHFRKFSIDDSRSAMKIGTDAVLLGAWTPTSNYKKVLDIGTGSGILALMVAQKNLNCVIDAIDISRESALLAQSNFELSPWNNRLTAYHNTFQDFSKTNHAEYDLIICNPPFFTKSLKATGNERIMARHDDNLPAEQLFEGVSLTLTNDGAFACIFPYNNLNDKLICSRKHNLHAVKLAHVKSTNITLPHRAMVLFTKNNAVMKEDEEIIIYNTDRSYTSEYQKLTRDYYLKF